MEGDENEAGITISVIDTEIHSEKLTKHVRYSISGKDQTGPFACVRRYKEFASLRQVLVTMWPGCYVPQIPQKQAMVRSKQGNLENQFILLRRRLLDYFLKQIAQLDYLYSCDAFQTFIRGPVDYLKVCQDMKNIGYVAISQNFMNRYPGQASFHMSQESESQVEDAAQYFKTGLEALEKFEMVCKENWQNYSELKNDIKHMMVGVKEISSFYAEKYGASPVQVLEKEGMGNPYEDLLFWTQQDILDLRAILDCLNTRQVLSKIKTKIQEKIDAERGKLVKAQSGKKSLGQIFSKKSKEDRVLSIETEIKRCEEEIESCSTILTIITGRLIESVIPEFKDYKTKNFEFIMQKFVQASINDYNHLIDEANFLKTE